MNPRKPHAFAILLAGLLLAFPAASQKALPASPEEILTRSLQSASPPRAELEEALSACRKKGDVPCQAKFLVLLGMADGSAGRRPQAMASYEEALRLLETIHDRLGMAVVALHMGDSAMQAKDYAAAREHFERAAKEAGPLEAPGQKLSSEMLAFVLHLLGIPVNLFDGGSQGLEDVVRMAEPALLAAFQQIALLALVESHLGLSDCVGALEAMTRLREIGAKTGSSQTGWIVARMLEEQMKRVQKQLEEACGAVLAPPVGPQGDPAAEIAELDRKIEEARRQGDLPAEADLLSRLASVYQYRKDFEQALASFEQALEITLRLPDLGRRARAHSALGYHLILWSRPEEALVHLQKALAIRRRIGGDADIATLLIFLGAQNSVLGFRSTAVEQLTEGLALARKLRAPLVESEALFALAETHFLAGEPAQARAYLRELLAQAVNPLQRSRALIAFSADCFREGQDAEGEEHASEALKLAEQLGLTEVAALAHGHLAGLAHRRGLTDQAHLHLDHSRALLHEGGFRFLEAAATALKGVWLFHQGDPDRGTALYREGLDLYETIQGELRVPDLLSGLNDQSGGTLYEGYVELLFARGDAKAAFEYGERARARAFLNEVGNRRIGRPAGAARELVAKAEEVRGKLRSLEAIQQAGPRLPAGQGAEGEGPLGALRTDYSQLLLQLKLADPEYATLVQIETIDLDRLQRNVLEPGTVLVEYFVTPKRTLAWVIDRETFRMVEIQRTPKELRQQVEELRGLLGRHSRHGRKGRGAGGLSPSAEEVLREKASALHDALIEPLKLPDRRQQVIIVPHGVLHYVPFAALWNRSKERYLVEDFTLSYAPSASILPYLANKRSPSEGRALVLGDPDLGPLAKELPPLTAARQEAVVIAQLLGTTPVTGRAATESLILEKAGKIDLLHLAAHGVYKENHASYSRIELAADRRNDGHLEAHELMSRVDLQGVDLVVLSACASGLGDRSNGDEVVGLVRAFLYAGSPAVVATLWAIDDAASKVLMKAFYRRLRQGDRAAEALRAAQLEVMGQPRWRSPFFWAAFSLTGEPGSAPFAEAAQRELPHNP